MAKKKTDPDKLLDSTIESIRKQFGEGAIMKLGEKSALDVETFPTGSLALDIALGVGGIPKGRVIEIYGAESSGKTTLALHMVAEAQKQGGVAAFIDAEHALDPSYAKKLKVQTENLLVSQPDTGEQALEICDSLVKSGSVDLIVVDSVAALVPKAEIDGDMGDSHVGLQARLMSQALRKLTSSIAKTKTTVIFINQIRMKIGVMFGNPETTTGGMALKFYSSLRIEVRKLSALKNSEEQFGNEIKLSIRKNKVAPPFKTAMTSIFYNKGINKYLEILLIGTTIDIVTKVGTWYSYGDTRLGQGKINSTNFLEENPEIANEIEKKIRIHYELIESDEKKEENLPKEKEKESENKKTTKSTKK